MRWKYPKKIAAFNFLALIALFAQILFFPPFHLMVFIPVLAASTLSYSLTFSLWNSFLTGLLLDLITTQFPFGAFAFLYFVVTLAMYTQKQFFYSDKAHSFFIYTFLFSFCMTASQFLLAKIMGFALTFTFKGIFTNFIVMPFIDSLYGIIWLYFPYKIYKYFNPLYDRRH